MGQRHNRLDRHYFSWAKSLAPFKLFIISTNLPRCPWASIRKMTGWQRSKQPYTWKRNGKRVQGLGHKINCLKRHREDLLSRAPRAGYQVGQNTIITNPSSLKLSERFPNMPPAYPGYNRAREGSCVESHLRACNYGWQITQAEQTCHVSENTHRLWSPPLQELILRAGFNSILSSPPKLHPKWMLAGGKVCDADSKKMGMGIESHLCPWCGFGAGWTLLSCLQL